MNCVRKGYDLAGALVKPAEGNPAIKVEASQRLLSGPVWILHVPPLQPEPTLKQEVGVSISQLFYMGCDIAFEHAS